MASTANPGDARVGIPGLSGQYFLGSDKVAKSARVETYLELDYDYLKLRKCEGLELSMIPIRCAIPINHKLASKEKLMIEDLFGENLMLKEKLKEYEQNTNRN